MLNILDQYTILSAADAYAFQGRRAIQAIIKALEANGDSVDAALILYHMETQCQRIHLAAGIDPESRRQIESLRIIKPADYADMLGQAAFILAGLAKGGIYRAEGDGWVRYSLKQETGLTWCPLGEWLGLEQRSRMALAPQVETV